MAIKHKPNSLKKPRALFLLPTAIICATMQSDFYRSGCRWHRLPCFTQCQSSDSYYQDCYKHNQRKTNCECAERQTCHRLTSFLISAFLKAFGYKIELPAIDVVGNSSLWDSGSCSAKNHPPYFLRATNLSLLLKIAEI